MGVKSNDTETVPLCSLHHREQHRLGKTVFEDKYGISFRDIVERLTQKPRISIENNQYVATLEGMPQERYFLGDVSIGRKEAIRRAIGFFREQFTDLITNQRKPVSSSGRRTGVSAAGGEWPWLL